MVRIIKTITPLLGHDRYRARCTECVWITGRMRYSAEASNAGTEHVCGLGHVVVIEDMHAEPE